MLILEYHPDGICVPDVKAMETAESFIERANEQNQMYEVKFSQAIVLDSVRVLMKRGVIDCSLVQIKFKDNLIYSNKEGRLSDWPTGFCDHTENNLMELLG